MFCFLVLLAISSFLLFSSQTHLNLLVQKTHHQNCNSMILISFSSLFCSFLLLPFSVNNFVSVKFFLFQTWLINFCWFSCLFWLYQFNFRFIYLWLGWNCTKLFHLLLGRNNRLVGAIPFAVKKWFRRRVLIGSSSFWNKYYNSWEFKTTATYLSGKKSAAT